MPYICDHCDEEIRPDANGFFVGNDRTSDCAENTGGHEWEGRRGL